MRQIPPTSLAASAAGAVEAVSLRPYQTKILDETRALMQKGCKSILITSPTGSGKTLLTAFMLKGAAMKNFPSFFMVHRKELVDQSSLTFQDVGLPHGIIAADYSSSTMGVTKIVQVQTLSRRLSRVDAPRLIIWDECHHLPSNSWSRIHAAYPNAFHIGLSATPQRMDGKGLGQYFKAMVKGPPVAALIKEGYLSPYRLFAPSMPDVSKLHSRRGDFVKSELEQLIDKPAITGDAIYHYLRIGKGKQALAFCASIQHSKNFVDMANQAGIKAAHIDAETPREQRRVAMAMFRAHDLQLLSNVDLFGEGLDVPGCEVGIFLRPTESLTIASQQWGRILRPYAGKTAILLDHAGNSQRFGLPDDDYDWNLEGRSPIRRNAEGPAIRICPNCYAAQKSGLACDFCSVVFPIEPRKITEKDGELQEVLAVRRTRKWEQKTATSFEALVALGQRRQYKNPWAWARYVLEGRGR